MNAEKILEIIAKGFTLIEALRQATEAASPAIKALYDLIERQKAGVPIGDDDLARVQAILDEQLAIFNAPLPPEG